MKYAAVRAEPWGDIFDPEAQRKWLPIVNGKRLCRGREPAFFDSKGAALREARRVAREIGK